MGMIDKVQAFIEKTVTQHPAIRISPANFKAVERAYASLPNWRPDTLPRSSVGRGSAVLIYGHEIIADESVGDAEIVIRCEL